MITCRFNHLCSFMVEAGRFRVMGKNEDGTQVDESGRWSRDDHFDLPRGAVNVREAVVHVWCDNGAVYEFNAEYTPLTIIRLG